MFQGNLYIGAAIMDDQYEAWIGTQSSRRPDGTNKGLGYFGPLERPDGDVSTELSLGVGLGEGETLIPALVPTLTGDELKYLLGGGEITDEIMRKAVDHARERMGRGLSPFAD